MPFCSQCGHQVGDRDSFCGSCGARQPFGSPRPPYGGAFPDQFLSNFSPRTLAVLCYIPLLGWLASIVVLASQSFRRDLTLRFHAFQGLYLFAAYLVVDWAVQPIFAAAHLPFRPDHLLRGLIIGLWIFMIVKASHGEAYALPVIGELASRSAEEK
jgi:uncharacterized membrane protein